jgi:hypothetical protein
VKIAGPRQDKAGAGQQRVRRRVAVVKAVAAACVGSRRWLEADGQMGLGEAGGRQAIGYEWAKHEAARRDVGGGAGA